MTAPGWGGRPGWPARLELAEPVVRALEWHETRAHAIPRRTARDLGDAVLLADPLDRAPFWNRLQAVRWPTAPAAFDTRLADALALFSVLDRRPHVWCTPAAGAPPDLADRLRAHGFRGDDGWHLLAREPLAAPPAPPPGTTVEVVRGGRGDDGPRGAAADAGLVLAEAFGEGPGRADAIAGELAAALGDPRVALVLLRADGVPAAAARVTAFDGLAYLSSVGTRPAWRGRGLGAAVTRAALALAGASGAGLAYLGVADTNADALRLYGRLGFGTLGAAPALLL